MARDIAIIGSGPSYQSVGAETAYFANYSILRPECISQRGSFTRIVIVLSEAALFPEVFLSDVNRVQEIVEHRELLLQADFDAIEVMESGAPRIREVSVSCPVPVEYISLSSQKRMLKDLCNTTLPIWDRVVLARILQLPRLKRRQVFYHLLKCKYEKFTPRHIHVHGAFRPSTGVMTLLRALSKHGSAAKYHITGFQIGPRRTHAISKSSLSNSLPNARMLPQHELADEIVMRRLVASMRENLIFFPEKRD